VAERNKRSYDASRRRELAAQSRARVLDAARRHFTEHGYAATTIAAIAADADVSVQSITKNFGNKPGLVRALFDTALVGDDDATPLADRSWITAIHAEPDPRTKLRMFADTLAAILPRTAPVQLLIREAAADPGLDAVWQQIKFGRLMGMTDMAENLAAGGHLRSDITVEHARDLLWTYSAPEIYELLVMERGHSTEDYAAFIATGTVAALLPARTTSPPTKKATRRRQTGRRADVGARARGPSGQGDGAAPT
jgi:AcrR family transcriptional regulator